MGARTDGFLPPFAPFDPQRLQRYLQRRDLGPPSVAPAAGELVQLVPALGFKLDQLSWVYAQPTGDDVLRADGFLLFAECIDTAEPAGTIYMLGIDCRRFEMLWPDGVIRSYAVATFRTTYADQERSAQHQPASWKGIT